MFYPRMIVAPLTALRRPCATRGASLTIIAAVVLITSYSTSSDAQTIQLPTTRTFGYSGSVLVPDQGNTSLGGVRRGAVSSSGRLTQRGYGQTQGHSGISVSAHIIDLDEIDRQIRGVGQPALKWKSQREQQIEVGKATVRRARQLYREDQHSKSFDQYMNAIKILDGRLQRLARKEFRRVFGPAADHALKSFQL